MFCLSLCLSITLFNSLLFHKTGEACSSDDSCRFDYDLCENGVCKVNPSMQIDASAKTTVSVSTNAYDTRLSGNYGCGTTGCLPDLTRDGNTEDESRWSCSKSLGSGTCYVEYAFDSPQDVISMNIAFYKGNERTRTIEVGRVEAFFVVVNFIPQDRLSYVLVLGMLLLCTFGMIYLVFQSTIG